MASGWVWVDFENTPQVLCLEPFIRRLRGEGCEVRITARPQAQTLELSAARGIAVTPIGNGNFVRPLEKMVGGGLRSLELTHWVLRQDRRPRVLLSSSRSASLAAWFVRLRAVGLLDYEHATQRPLAIGCETVWLPDALRDAKLSRMIRRVARFHAGLKENLYLDDWQFDRAAERSKLGVSADEYLVVARPPATTAHYASNLSDRLWLAAVRSLSEWPGVRILISPRTISQREHLAQLVPRDPPVRMLHHVVAGPGLVAAADLVLGGGGTMNREAAVLGVPVWSVFCGPAPAIDERLAIEGRLRWVRSERELSETLALERPTLQVGRGPFPEGFASIYGDIVGRANGSVPLKERAYG